MSEFTVKKLKGAEPYLEKVALEIRYRDGYSYLDNCGKLLNTIFAKYPEWSIDSKDPNPQSANLFSFENGATLVVNTRHLVLSLEKPVEGDSLKSDDLQVFKEQVESVVRLAIDLLGITERERVGCRAWYLFPFDSEEACQQWIQKLGLVSVPPSICSSFDGTLSACGVALVLESEDGFKYRIACNGSERNSRLDIGGRSMMLRESKLQPSRQELLEKMKQKRRISANAGPFPAMIDIDVFKEPGSDRDLDLIVDKAAKESYQRVVNFVRGKK